MLPVASTSNSSLTALRRRLVDDQRSSAARSRGFEGCPPAGRTWQHLGEGGPMNGARPVPGARHQGGDALPRELNVGFRPLPQTTRKRGVVKKSPFGVQLVAIVPTGSPPRQGQTASGHHDPRDALASLYFCTTTALGPHAYRRPRKSSTSSRKGVRRLLELHALLAGRRCGLPHGLVYARTCVVTRCNQTRYRGGYG